VEAEEGKNEHDHDDQANEIDQTIHCRLQIDAASWEFKRTSGVKGSIELLLGWLTPSHGPSQRRSGRAMHDRAAGRSKVSRLCLTPKLAGELPYGTSPEPC
jgi:hypothetical protein